MKDNLETFVLFETGNNNSLSRNKVNGNGSIGIYTRSDNNGKIEEKYSLKKILSSFFYLKKN